MGQMKEGGGRGKITNEDLLNLLREMIIMKSVMTERLRWAGHVVMMDPEDRVKPVSYTHLDVYKRQVAASFGRGGKKD